MPTAVPPAAFDHLRAAVDLIFGTTDQITEIAVILSPSPRITISVAIVPDEPDLTIAGA